MAPGSAAEERTLQESEAFLVSASPRIVLAIEVLFWPQEWRFLCQSVCARRVKPQSLSCSGRYPGNWLCYRADRLVLCVVAR